MVSEPNNLVVPGELVETLGVQVGSRVEWTSTGDGLTVRLLPDRAEIERSLRGEGRRLMPNAGSQVEALLRDREEDDRLDFILEFE